MLIRVSLMRIDVSKVGYACYFVNTVFNAGFAGFAAIVLSAAVNCVRDGIFRSKLMLDVPLLFKSK